VVQLHTNGSAEIVDRNRRIKTTVSDAQLVQVAERRTSEVAQLIVMALALELTDHHNRKHHIVLVETPHGMRITQQDGGVDDVGATA